MLSSNQTAVIRVLRGTSQFERKFRRCLFGGGIYWGSLPPGQYPGVKQIDDSITHELCASFDCSNELDIYIIQNTVPILPFFSMVLMMYNSLQTHSSSRKLSLYLVVVIAEFSRNRVTHRDHTSSLKEVSDHGQLLLTLCSHPPVGPSQCNPTRPAPCEWRTLVSSCTHDPHTGASGEQRHRAHGG